MPSMEEIKQHHYGQWLAVEVTTWDDIEGPVEGVLMDHDPDPRALEDRLPVAKDRLIAYFFNGPDLPEGSDGFLL